jgi:Uma2 family endonuclease
VAPETRLLTAEDLLHLPDDDYRYELVAGRLIRMPPPGALHGFIISGIGSALHRFVEERGLGYVFIHEVGFKLASDPDTVRGTDVAFVRRDRLPTGIPAGYVSGAPDLTVEVMSPDDRLTALIDKAHQYLQHGGRLVWVIDPDDQSASVFRPGSDPVVLSEPLILDGQDVVPGFRFVLRGLFEKASRPWASRPRR